MRKALLVFCILALATLSSGLSAQGTLEATVGSNESIVRVYNGKDAVICNNKTQFIYLPNGATAGPSFTMPTDIEVNDFEVIGDTVWFCGLIYGFIPFGSAGVVGFFDIPGAFAGTEYLEYAVTPNWTQYGYTYEESMYIRNMTRIDVLRDPEMGPVAALLADAVLYTTAQFGRVTVLSAYHQGGTWHLHGIFPKDGRMHFTDIAYLDDVVVATGYGISGTHLLTKAFVSGASFPCTPCHDDYYDSIYCQGFTPVGDVRIAHVYDNIAALVQMNNKPATLFHVLSFNITTGKATPHTPSRNTKVAGCDIYSCNWRLDEIRYSSTNNTIHILERGLLPGDATDHTLLWKFPLLYGGEATAEVQKMTGLNQMSMDVDINQNPVTSGIVEETNLLDLHIFAPGGVFVPLIDPLFPGNDPEYDVCTYNTEGGIDVFNITIKDRTADDPCINPTPYAYQYLPVIREVLFNIICE